MDIDNLISGAVGESLQDAKKPLDQAKKTDKRGRKNKGLTDAHYAETKKKMRKEYRAFKYTKNSSSFEVVEAVRGEVVSYNNLKEFKELYSLTCSAVLEEFKENNSELVKKAPFLWYKLVLLDIKKNVPSINADEIEKCVAVWDCLSDLLYSIGLYPTFEIFSYMTNIYKYQLEKRQNLSPKYMEFLKKINIEADNALISELAYNPYNQTNKIFLAKVHGIVEKSEPKTIEVNHNIRNYDSLPMFSSNFLEDHQQ